MADLTTLTTDLAAYRAARDAVLTAQEYRIGTRTLRRPDLQFIEKKIEELEARIEMVKRGGKIMVGHARFGGHRG